MAEDFIPYIHVEGEQSVPSSITLFAATGGGWNKISLPDGLSPAKQLAAVPDLIGEYLKRYGGFCPFFGRAVAFRLVHSHDESYRFDLDGVLIERIDGAFHRPGVELRIGHQTVSSLFLLAAKLKPLSLSASVAIVRLPASKTSTIELPA